MSSQAERKRKSDLAKTLMKIQGIDHEQWLEEQYNKIIDEGYPLITEALEKNSK